MDSVNNVLVATSGINNFSVAQINAMNDSLVGLDYRFFSSTASDGTTLLVRSEHSFHNWLKNRQHFESLAKYYRGPVMGTRRDSKLTGLFWRASKGRLYAMYDGRTIPWSNWCEWCEKKLVAKSNKHSGVNA